MTLETKKSLKLKSLVYLLQQSPLFKAFWEKPLFYLKRYFFQKKPTTPPFFHGLQSSEELKKLIEDPSNRLLLGFSYCQKPLFCPSGRFNNSCLFDPALCQNCFIGKCFQKQKKLKNSEKMIITTVASLAEKLLSLSSSPSATPNKIIFLISTCPLALSLFQDFPALLDLKGRSFPLFGMVCSSFKAFLLAEKGQKKENSRLSAASEKEILEFLEIRKKLF